MKPRLILLALLISLSMLGLTGCGIFGGSINYSKRDVIMRYNMSAPKDLVMFGGSFDDKKNNLVGISVPIGSGKRTCALMVGGKTEKPVVVYAMFPCNVNNYQRLGIYNLIIPELRPSNNVDQTINMLPLMEHFYKSTIYAVDDSLDLSTVLKDIGFYSLIDNGTLKPEGLASYALSELNKKLSASAYTKNGVTYKLAFTQYDELGLLIESEDAEDEAVKFLEATDEDLAIELVVHIPDDARQASNAPEFITFNGASAYSLLDKFQKFNALRT